MAMRRELFDRVGVFDTSLGRMGGKLIGGEESELFERIYSLGMKCYYAPRAVMYHIIPAEKLTTEYFERLCYNTGVSQLTRAKIHNRITRLYIGEAMKWCATLLLCLLHRPAQSRHLIKMRREITRGILQR